MLKERREVLTKLHTALINAQEELPMPD